MNTKNIFKTVACAMLMPAVLLTTSCSKGDDAVTNPEKPATTETAINKGYALPVTVNVTRQGDADTRATYTDNGDGTGSLGFSAGDKLFVSGQDNGGAESFAGTLDYVSEGTFSGTIYTENPYSGTADELFSAATSISATLLPNGYDANGINSFLYVDDNGTTEAYDDIVDASGSNAFVASETAKATGVEQLSYEQATTYSSGFALAPLCAILNFTISGLEAGAQDVTLYVTREGAEYTVTGSVTPNASGVATFAIGVPGGFSIKDVSMSNNLSVGSHKFTLPGGTALAAGKIYNITRGTGAIVDLSTINANYTAQNGQTLTGTLASNVKISIADGATVILNGVSINAAGTWTGGNYAGITCLGDATIILSGTNTVKGFYDAYPGIYVPVGSTVTINGTGSLTASSNGWGAGIGGGFYIDCGNIEIQGGTITATGGNFAAGIGSGIDASCGTITISGGTVTATGGDFSAGIGGGHSANCGTITISGGTVTATGGGDAAGIGSGYDTSCGTITISGGTITATGGDHAAGIGGGNSGRCVDITITTGVTKVTATKGSGAPNSIGAGDSGTCGTVTIGGTVGAITDSPYTYQP